MKNRYTVLRNIFEESLSVNLLAENIICCKSDDDAEQIKKEMQEQDFDVYGVSEEEIIIGYVLREKLSNGIIKDYTEQFKTEHLISDSTSIIELLEFLRERSYLFILEKNKVSKIVTLADLHKQPIRMMVFSLISLFEMYLTSSIKESFPNESWKDMLSVERLKKAKDLMVSRKEKNEALTLLDNTQLADKGTIIGKSLEHIKQLGFESKNQWKKFFGKLEQLRNNIAHAQEEIFNDNLEVINLVLQLDQVLKKFE